MDAQSVYGPAIIKEDESRPEVHLLLANFSRGVQLLSVDQRRLNAR
jgi:hypothetical protein